MRPLPSTPEGWDAWTLADLRELIESFYLWPQNPDRAHPQLAAHLDDVIRRLKADPWPLKNTSRVKKIALVTETRHRTAIEARWTQQAMGELLAAVSFKKPTTSQTVARGLRDVPETAGKLLPENRTSAAFGAGVFAAVVLVLATGSGLPRFRP